jgi:hypothetical protein
LVATTGETLIPNSLKEKEKRTLTENDTVAGLAEYSRVSK